MKQKKKSLIYTEASNNHVISRRQMLLGSISLFIFWIFACFPYFGKSFIPTHDGEFHIIRFYEFYKMLSDGHLFPRWAPDLNSGYGMPLFIFHYPFPNYVGAFFHSFGASFIDSFKLSLVFAYLVAIISCYFYLIRKTSNFYAISVTLLFATVPYWFIDMGIRGSIGEVWAIAWFMTALASLAWNKHGIFGLSILLLCISHNIMAMIALPVLAIYISFFNRSFYIPLILGIIGASYFWIPALLEKNNMVGLNTSTFSDHFPTIKQLLLPYWGSGFSGPGADRMEMSQQIGIVPLLIYLFVLVKLFINKQTKSPIIVSTFVIVAISCFLMLEISKPIWGIFPLFQYIQYPWRLLSIIIITMPILGYFVLEEMNKWSIVILIFLSLFLSYKYMRPVEYQPRNDIQYIQNPNFTDGTSSMGNSFSTIWTGWKSQRPPSKVTVERGNVQIRDIVSRTTKDTFSITAQENADLLIHRLYYPGWEVTLNGKSLPIQFEKEGILRITVPPGTYKVIAEFHETPLRMISNILSIVACIVLLLSPLNKHYERSI